MSVRRVFWAFATLLAAPSAYAQDAAGRCERVAPPFALGESNRLRGAELARLLPNKSMTYFRISTTNQAQNRQLKLNRQFRADGSALFTCEMGPSRAGPWRPCRRIAAEESAVEGSREIGVWQIRGDALCFRFVTLGAGEALCFHIHREGRRFYAQTVPAGSNCLEGDFALD